MKHLLLAALVLLGLRAGAQEAKMRMQRLDTLLQEPLHNKLITDEAYAAMLYQKQVALSGLAVQQGKTLGTNLTVDDKNVVLNVGLPNIPVRQHLNLAVIATGRFTPEEGFVKLFSGDKFQQTFTVGGNFLLFGDGFSNFGERTKKDFHWRLRQLRQQDKLKWSDSLTPYNAATWQGKYAPAMATFIQKWRNFQQWLNDDPQRGQPGSRADRFYKGNGNFNSVELDDREGQRRYLDYLDAEHQVLPLLGEDWDEMPQKEEIAFVRLQLSRVQPGLLPPGGCLPEPALVDSLKASAQFTYTLEKARQLANEGALKTRYELYDSLQQHTPWVKKWRWWLTLTSLYNAGEQPVFNLANKAQTYADVYQDKYWQLLASYNTVLEGPAVNTYFSLGAGTTTALQVKKSDLLTYQTSAWRRTGPDSVLVVTQKSLYAALPPRSRYLTLQTQLTLTLARGLPGFGATASYEGQFAEEKHGVHSLTLGLVAPVRTTKTNLLFIPLVRARSADLPDRWSYGFSVTASIPGLSK